MGEEVSKARQTIQTNRTLREQAALREFAALLDKYGIRPVPQLLITANPNGGVTQRFSITFQAIDDRELPPAVEEQP